MEEEKVVQVNRHTLPNSFRVIKKAEYRQNKTNRVYLCQGCLYATSAEEMDVYLDRLGVENSQLEQIEKNLHRYVLTTWQISQARYCGVAEISYPYLLKLRDRKLLV